MAADVELLAAAAVLGLDAMRLATSALPDERALARAVIDRTAELRAQLDDALAIRIANAVGQLFGGRT